MSVTLVEVQHKLLSAPESVAQVVASGALMGVATASMVRHGFASPPPIEEVARSFWKRFVAAGGTDEDFAWMLDRGFVTPSDFEWFTAAREGRL